VGVTHATVVSSHDASGDPVAEREAPSPQLEEAVRQASEQARQERERRIEEAAPKGLGLSDLDLPKSQAPRGLGLSGLSLPSTTTS
jgi:hypothetical protein